MISKIGNVAWGIALVLLGMSLTPLTFAGVLFWAGVALIVAGVCIVITTLQ